MPNAKQTVIHAGLNDATTHEQKLETSRYISVLRHVCRNYHVPFSVNVLNGCYFHENGDYVEENTLMLTLVDVPDETVEQIATDLCVFFHQESVLVVRSGVSTFFVGGSLND